MPLIRPARSLVMVAFTCCSLFFLSSVADDTGVLLQHPGTLEWVSLTDGCSPGPISSKDAAVVLRQVPLPNGTVALVVVQDTTSSTVLDACRCSPLDPGPAHNASVAPGMKSSLVILKPLANLSTAFEILDGDGCQASFGFAVAPDFWLVRPAPRNAACRPAERHLVVCPSANNTDFTTDICQAPTEATANSQVCSDLTDLGEATPPVPIRYQQQAQSAGAPMPAWLTECIPGKHLAFRLAVRPTTIEVRYNVTTSEPNIRLAVAARKGDSCSGAVSLPESCARPKGGSLVSGQIPIEDVGGGQSVFLFVGAMDASTQTTGTIQLQWEEVALPASNATRDEGAQSIAFLAIPLALVLMLCMFCVMSAARKRRRQRLPTQATDLAPAAAPAPPEAYNASPNEIPIADARASTASALTALRARRLGTATGPPALSALRLQASAEHAGQAVDHVSTLQPVAAPAEIPLGAARASTAEALERLRRQRQGDRMVDFSSPPSHRHGARQPGPHDQTVAPRGQEAPPPSYGDLFPVDEGRGARLSDTLV